MLWQKPSTVFKPEVILRSGPWWSFEAVEDATLEWGDWFKHCRLLEPIGNIPQAEAEHNQYAMLDEPPMAAKITQTASGKLGAVPCGISQFAESPNLDWSAISAIWPKDAPSLAHQRRNNQ